MISKICGTKTTRPAITLLFPPYQHDSASEDPGDRKCGTR